MKNEKGLIVVIVVLVVLNLGLLGHAIVHKYDIKLSSSCNDESVNVYKVRIESLEAELEGIKEKNATREEKICTLKLENRSFAQVIDAEKFKVIIDTNGYVYLHYNGEKNIADESIQNYLKLEKNYAISDIKGFEYYLGYTSVSAYKLNISNVVCGFGTYIGNGGFYYVFLLKEDGTLAYIVFNKNTSAIGDVKNVTGLTNVISVLRSDSYMAANAYAVISNGSMVNLRSYMGD